MTGTAQRNYLRRRSVEIARAWKELLPRYAARAIGVAFLFVALRLAGALTCWAYRRVFIVPEGDQLRLAAHHVLADLRDFTAAEKPMFNSDALIMARLQGRRDVWLRITRYLNLDEAQVQTLMEIDDGIGG